MSISNTTETAILNLIFNATTWANYAINATASPQTSIDVTLNTGDPGDTGTMSTSETGYTNYARVPVLRDNTGWTVGTGTVSPAANIDFALGGGTPDTATHFTVGKTGGGALAYLWSGTVTPNIATGTGVIPRLTTATSITLDSSWIAAAAIAWLLFKFGGITSWLISLGGSL